MARLILAASLLSLAAASAFAQGERTPRPFEPLTEEVKAFLLGVWAEAKIGEDKKIADMDWQGTLKRCANSIFANLATFGSDASPSAKAKMQIFPKASLARGELVMFETEDGFHVAKGSFGEPNLYRMSSVTFGSESGRARLFLDRAMYAETMDEVAPDSEFGAYWGDMLLGEVDTPAGPRPIVVPAGPVAGAATPYVKCDL